MRCTRCDYPLWNLPTPRCPECGQAFSLRDFCFTPGTVAFACPHCGEQYRGWGMQHLPKPPDGRCRRCGEAIDDLAMLVVPLTEDPTDADATPARRVPWDMKERLGPCRRWWQTLGLAITRPDELGRRLRTYTPRGTAFFAIVAHCAFFATTTILVLVQLVRTGGPAGEVVSCALFGLALAGFVSPLVVTALWAIPAHALMNAVGSKLPSEVTLACLFYSQGPVAAGCVLFVPVAGPWLALLIALCVWSSAAVSLAHAHRVPWWVALVAVSVTPLVFIGFVAILNLAEHN